LKYIVDNSDEIVEDVDGVKNTFVVTIQHGTMQSSAVLGMVSAVLEDSVL
jgi:hypothetical protein